MKHGRTMLMLTGIAVLLVSVIVLFSSNGRNGDAVEEVAKASPTKRNPSQRAVSSIESDVRGSISGLVTTGDKSVVPGVAVCARAEGEGDGAGSQKCARTNAHGIFVLEDLRAGHYALAVAASGFHALRNTEVALSAGEARTKIHLTVYSTGYRVSGRVEDLFGGGVEGAQLLAYRGTIRTSLAMSGAEGEFEVFAPAGVLELRVSADGYATAKVAASAPAENLRIALAPESVISGLVVTSAGQPVSGAIVTAFSEDIASVAATSGQDGTFRIGRLPPGRYTLSASGDRVFGRYAGAIVVGVAESVDDIRLVVMEARRVEGQVLVASSETPCSKATVTLSAEGGFKATAVGDESGVIVFNAVPPDTYRTAAACEGRVPNGDASLVVEDQDVVGVRWLVEEGAHISGRVVDSSDGPLPGVPVWASGPTSVRGGTDDAGAFNLTGLIPGQYSVAIEPSGGPSPAPQVVNVPESGVDGLVFTVAEGVKVTGVVVDADDTPVPDVFVTADDGDVTHTKTTSTGTDGSFALVGLASGGATIWCHTSSGEILPIVGGRNDKLSLEVDVAGENVVRLQLRTSLESIRGTVRDEDGPAADVYVVAALASGARAGPMAPPPSNKHIVITDAAGAFEVQSLPAGQYDVEAYRRGGAARAAVQGVETGSEVELFLRSACSLRGSVSSASGTPPSFTVAATSLSEHVESRDTFFHTGGKWALSELQEGSYEVRAIAKSGASEARRVQCNAQADGTRLSLAIVEFGGLKGRLVDAATGAGVRGHIVNVAPNGGSFQLFASADFVAKSATTSSSGNFELSDVPAGTQVVIAIPGAWESAVFPPLRKRVAVVAGEVTELPEWKIPKLRLSLRQRPGNLGFAIHEPGDGEDVIDTQVIVASTEPGGPAETAGMVPGDEIVSVDGQDISGDNWVYYYALTRVPPGTALRFDLMDERSVTVVAGPPK